MSDKSTAPMQAPFNDVVRFKEGCRLLGVSREGGEHYLRIPGSDFPRPFFIGKRRYFRRSDLLAWIEAKATAAQQAPYVPAQKRA